MALILIEWCRDKIKANKFRESYITRDDFIFEHSLADLDYLKPGEFGLQYGNKSTLLKSKTKYISTKEILYKSALIKDLDFGKSARSHYYNCIVWILLFLAIFIGVIALGVYTLATQ